MTIREESEVVMSHKKAGYPAMSEADQAQLLLTHNPEIINKIPGVVQAREVPPFIYRHYVKLKKQAFKNYFIKSDYIEQQLAEHLKNPMHDGMHIIAMYDGSFEARELERGNAFEITKLADRNALNDFLIDQIYIRHYLDDRLNKH